MDRKVRIPAVDIVSWIEHRDMSANVSEAAIHLLQDLMNDVVCVADMRKDFKDKMKQHGHTRYDKARWTYGGLWEDCSPLELHREKKVRN